MVRPHNPNCWEARRGPRTGDRASGLPGSGMRSQRRPIRACARIASRPLTSRASRMPSRLTEKPVYEMADLRRESDAGSHGNP